MKMDNKLNVLGASLLALFTIMLSTGGNVFLNEAKAAATDIATVPIFTSNSSANLVKPNLMMILDDSGSMVRKFMPDEAEKFSINSITAGVEKYGFSSSQCNGVYYNPTIVYQRPIEANGTIYPNSSFTNAWVDGYNTAGAKVNISTSFQAEDTGSIAQPAYYYRYKGTQTTTKLKNYDSVANSTFYKECISPVGSAPGNAVFDKVIVSATSGPATADINSDGVVNSSDKDERQNFANWYSYYRNRLLMMKTSTGLAFEALDDKFRVGFMAINDKDSAGNNKLGNFLNISDFSSTQKTNWYAKLYGSTADGRTPTRRALSQAGLLYGGKISTINGVTAVDPVQYACQRNYTILSTDGYWTQKIGAGAVDEEGATKLDGDFMDNQDHSLPRPFYDGTKVSYNTSTSQLNKLESRYTSTATHVTERDTQTQARTLQLQKKDTDSRVNQTSTQYQKRQNGYGTTTFIRQARQDSYTKTTFIRQLMQQQRTKTTVPWITRTVSYAKSTTQQQKRTKQFYRCNNEGSCVAHTSDCSSGTGSGLYTICKSDNFTAWVNSSCTAANGSPVTYCQDLSPVTTTTYGLGSCTAHAIDASGVTVTCTISDTGNVNLSPGDTCTANPSIGKTCTANTAASATVDDSACVASSAAGITCGWRNTTYNDLPAGTVCNTNVSTGTLCQNKSTGSTTQTVYPCSANTPIGVTCSGVITGSWVDLAAGVSCVGDATDTAAGKFCRNKPGSGVSVVGTCTPNAATGVTCGYIAGTGSWANVSQNNIDKCTTSTALGVECQNLAPITTLVNTCTTSDPVGGPTITCAALPAPSWVNTGTCNAGTVGTITTTCQTTNPAFTNATTCTAATINASGATVECQTIDPHVPNGWYGVTSCVDKAAASNAGKQVECSTTVDTPVELSTCACDAGIPDVANPTKTCYYSTTASATSPLTAWTNYKCEHKTVTPATPVPACTNEAASASNNNTLTTCSTITTGPTNGLACVASPASAANNYLQTTCSGAILAGGTENTLADTAAYYYNTNLRTTDLSNCGGPFYDASIPATDRCTPNLVAPYLDDTQTNQHMTTYTVGLGSPGQMIASSGYKTDGNLDYGYIKVDTTKTASTCTWEDSITKPGLLCNWPEPIADTTSTIDDLWHGAVNGHGIYFNAADPSELKEGLSKLLTTISDANLAGTFASSAAASPKISVSNNKLYSSYFKAGEWSGELISQTVDTATGAVPVYDPANPNPASYNWSAQSLLDTKCKPVDTLASSDGKACVSTTNRKVYTAGTSSNTGGTSGLIEFTWANIVSAGLDSHFKTLNIATNPPTFPKQATGLSQFCVVNASCLNNAAQTNYTVATNGAAGENLVNFIRGDRSLEEGDLPSADKYYRKRVHVLGDIVTSESQYVATSNQLLDEALNPGYATFKTTNVTRTPTIYTGANDGMLHAFDAATGAEKWAYIPSFVIPKLYTLADRNYKDKHQYFVEGTPKVSDVYINSQWRTILVGGLNAGGVGYYALDITNPNSPKKLWEFTDANMGYSFGNPVITKQSDGNWVVLLSSGYDNCPKTATDPNCSKDAAGDGKGHLYVLDAETGALVSSPSSDIATTEGSSTDPSGLAKVVGFAPVDNFTNKAYAGDLKGNLWRFTITPGGYAKQLLATFKDVDGNAQPITTKPVVTTVSGDIVVYVGTGRYLGLSDVGLSTKQSFYAVKDTGQSTSFGNPRSATANFIVQQATASTCPTAPADNTDTPNIDESKQYDGVCVAGEVIRSVTASTTDTLKERNGWILDFPTTTKEMSFTDPTIYSGTILFSTSEPIAGVSQVCGAANPGNPKSFSYKVNYLTGGSVDGQFGVVANDLGEGIATSPRLYITDKDEVLTETNKSDGPKKYGKPPRNPVVNPTKRLSWTEGE